MLKGAAGWLVGIGSGFPSARALARRYISLFVAPVDSIAAATTAQLRVSVVIILRNVDIVNLATICSVCDGGSRPGTEQHIHPVFVSDKASNNHGGKIDENTLGSVLSQWMIVQISALCLTGEPRQARRSRLKKRQFLTGEMTLC